MDVRLPIMEHSIELQYKINRKMAQQKVQSHSEGRLVQSEEINK